MNSSTTKETKNAAKIQKKNQKANKKQQQQQQQKLQHQTDLRNGKNAIIQNSSNSTGKGTKLPSTSSSNSTETTSTLNTPIKAHITNNNNNNNLAKDGIFLTPHVPMPRTILPGYENAPKFERSNSFSLKGKLSKFFNSITGSKENISKINNNNNEYDENGMAPYKFTRSRSMILLRRSNRRSLIEPQLEQLSEEAEKFGNDPTSPASPRKNSFENSNNDTTIGQLNRSLPAPVAAGTLSESPSLTPNRGQSGAPTFASSTPNDAIDAIDSEFTAIDPNVRLRKGSTLSLAAGTGNGVPTINASAATPASSSTSSASPAFNPQLNFQKRRSNTLISSFRTTLASLTGAAEKKKEKINPKWSASLQSLQAIDNMVSYENMSFIDYDKFNGYEKQIEKRLSTLSLMDTSDQQQQQQPSQSMDVSPSICSEVPQASSQFTPPQQPPLTPTQTVVRRRRKPSGCGVPSANGSSHSMRPQSSNSAQNISVPDRASYNFDTDYEHNLDKVRNVYRDSLDSRKLEILNDLTRDSFVLDKHIIDVLNLEDGSVGRRRSALSKQLSTGTFPQDKNGATDVTDCSSHIQVSGFSSTYLLGNDFKHFRMT